jgi:capsular polysaccharide biosynthesis protein
MENIAHDEIEIDLLELLYVLKSKLWLILLSGLVTAAATALVCIYLITPVYKSKTQLYILARPSSITDLSLADLQIGNQLTQDYMILVKSRPVVTKVIENLELDMTYEQLCSIIEVSSPSNTRILEIEVTYPDPNVAKQIVDEFAEVATERIATIMDTAKPSIVEEGYAQPKPSSPRTKRNTVIGGALGMLLAAGLFIVLHLMDDTIKDSEDVEKYLGISTLGLIPVEDEKADKHYKNKKKKMKK